MRPNLCSLSTIIFQLPDLDIMTASSPLTVLAITSPAFILIGLGYLTVKAGWLQKNGVQALGWFITRIAVPAAIFMALSSRSFEDILHWDYLLVYGIGSLLAFAVVLFIATVVRKKNLTEAAFFGLGSSMSNTILIGYPIIIEMFGTAALVPFALALVIENLLILPLSLALAETGKQQGRRFSLALVHSLKLLVKNPIIIAITIGIASSALSLRLPLVLNTTISSLAATVSGLAQFTIGAILAGSAVRMLSKDMVLVSAGKLLIHPAAVILMIMMLPTLDPMLTSVAIILACLPMFSIYAVLGMDYDLGEFCSAVLLPTTVISFLTINLAIWLLV